MPIYVWYMWEFFLEALIFTKFFCSWRYSKCYHQATLLLMHFYSIFFNYNLIKVYLNINPYTDQEIRKQDTKYCGAVDNQTSKTNVLQVWWHKWTIEKSLNEWAMGQQRCEGFFGQKLIFFFLSLQVFLMYFSSLFLRLNERIRNVIHSSR